MPYPAAELVAEAAVERAECDRVTGSVEVLPSVYATEPLGVLIRSPSAGLLPSNTDPAKESSLFRFLIRVVRCRRLHIAEEGKWMGSTVSPPV